MGLVATAKKAGLTGKDLREFVQKRLRDAVDRHTDWYASGYDNGQGDIMDGAAVKGMAKNQAYSPFVASSYEMSASDGFVTCGVTVPCSWPPRKPKDLSADATEEAKARYAELMEDYEELLAEGSPGERNHWMFIFKIKKSNWFTPSNLVDTEQDPVIDFDHMWFDETSFGDSSLAQYERAWDRLGSPIEEEHAEILYLTNVQ
jgi:hypothetical protein